MASGLTDNFYLNTDKPLDRRESFSTIEAMAKYQERYINNGRLTFCEEDKNYYQFFLNNPIDPITGKWRKVYFLSKELDVDNIKEPPTIDKTFNAVSDNAATAKATAAYMNNNFAKSGELLLTNKAVSALENKDVISDKDGNLLTQIGGKAYLTGSNLISSRMNGLEVDSSGKIYLKLDQSQEFYNFNTRIRELEFRVSALERK